MSKTRPSSPPVENENPFLNFTHDYSISSSLQPTIKEENFDKHRNQSNKEEESVPRRDRVKNKSKGKRVRSLFLDNNDRQEFSHISDLYGAKPRHVLSHSSYAIPYGSTCSLTRDISLTRDTFPGLDSKLNARASVSSVNVSESRKNSLKKSTKKFASLVKSGLEKLQKAETKKFFESKMKSEDNVTNLHTLS